MDATEPYDETLSPPEQVNGIIPDMADTPPPGAPGAAPVPPGVTDVEPPPPPRERTVTVGGILSHTFSVIGKNPGLFLALGFMSAIPGVFLTMETIDRQGLAFPVQMVNNGIQLLLQGAIAYGVFQAMRGEKAALGSALGRGLSRILPIIGAAVIIGILKVIGLLLLVVPCIIMSCVWAVTIPACVVERLGASKSMDRSAELTRGYRWSIFGLFTVLFIASLGIVFGLDFVTAQFTDNFRNQIAIRTTLLFIPQTFEMVMCSVLYYDLRADKEGVTVDSLASVFD